MKVRSTLLFAFMIVVPAAAMFSHRIPAEVRRSMREQVGLAFSALGSMTAAPSSEPVSGPGVPTRVTDPAPPIDGTDHAPPETATASVAAERPPMPSGTQVPPIDGRLADLGAVAFECRPVAGGAGGHVASCSVPLDASGQLLRVFHATGADGTAATAALVADVEAWRLRFDPQRSATLKAAEPARRF